jgi:uncharacterized membrane protein YecN with MAPEG domain
LGKKRKHRTKQKSFLRAVGSLITWLVKIFTLVAALLDIAHKLYKK